MSVSAKHRTAKEIFFSIISDTVRGYKFNHLAINSTIAVEGKAGFTLASAAIAVVEFMAKWSNLFVATAVIRCSTTSRLPF